MNSFVTDLYPQSMFLPKTIKIIYVVTSSTSNESLKLKEVLVIEFLPPQVKQIPPLYLFEVWRQILTNNKEFSDLYFL